MHKSHRLLILLIFLPLPLLLALFPSPRLPQADLPVYSDGLESG
jgi:hypothetical protein